MSDVLQRARESAAAALREGAFITTRDDNGPSGRPGRTTGRQLKWILFALRAPGWHLARIMIVYYKLASADGTPRVYIRDGGAAGAGAGGGGGRIYLGAALALQSHSRDSGKWGILWGRKVVKGRGHSEFVCWDLPKGAADWQDWIRIFPSWEPTLEEQTAEVPDELVWAVLRIAALRELREEFGLDLDPACVEEKPGDWAMVLHGAKYLLFQARCPAPVEDICLLQSKAEFFGFRLFRPFPRSGVSVDTRRLLMENAPPGPHVTAGG